MRYPFGPSESLFTSTWPTSKTQSAETEHLFPALKSPFDGLGDIGGNVVGLVSGENARAIDARLDQDGLPVVAALRLVRVGTCNV